MDEKLSRLDIDILDLLKQSRGPLPVSVIAHMLRYSYSAIWKHIRKLEKMGLVVRVPNKKAHALYTISSTLREKEIASLAEQIHINFSIYEISRRESKQEHVEEKEK